MVYARAPALTEAVLSSSSPPPPIIPRPPALPKDMEPLDIDPPPPSRRSSALLSVLAGIQLRHPGRVLTLSAVLTLLGLLLALRLQVLTGFENLLPEDRPSVQELERVAQKTAGVSMLFVVLQAPEDAEPPPTQALRDTADQLVSELETLGPPWVGSVESGVHEAIDYLAPRAGLFGDREKLQKLRDDVEARYTWEVEQKAGFDLGLDDEPEAPPEIDVDRLRTEFGLDGADEDRYPDGYYQSKDGRVVIVAVRSKVVGSDYAEGEEAIRRIKEVVDRVNPAKLDPRITYGFAGDLVTANSEYKAINDDLTEVGYLGAFLITGIVLLYYLRFRTLIAMLLNITVGLAITFGITELSIGHLNLATGFLFTIVAGNGINPSIMYMARYLEVRRRGGSVAEAIRTAHRETWLPTLTAMAAASAAFGSLLVTEFRGFRDFGLIGGAGMLTCWVATYWTLPAILVVTERVAPLGSPDKPGILAAIRRTAQGGAHFGRPFAAAVKAAPRLLLAVGLVFAAAGSVLMVRYIRSDPMEYDLRNLRTDETARADEIARSELAESITGHVGSDGMAILVERAEQVRPLQEVLRARRDAAPADAKPFKDVHALHDFVPLEQEAKIPLLLSIKEYVQKAHKRGLIEDEDWKKLERFIPPDDLRPFTMDDLPAGVARVFTESDGTRGRIVYISPVSAEMVDDAHYLFRWADAYRETKLPDGSVVLGSGRAVIYADMWAAIIGDVPPAVVLSLLATILVVIVAFRAGRPAVAVIASLLVGVAWMAGLLVLMGVKLNFLNFIALPITFGIGVDYGVNIVQRYVREGAGSVLVALRETGGAVVLCSLTTMLGYFALVGSMNFAVRSLGIATVIGELCCLASAILVLPAALWYLDRRRPHGGHSFISVHPPAR